MIVNPKVTSNTHIKASFEPKKLRRASSISFSKEIISSSTQAPYFPEFIATLIMCIWHEYNFDHLTINPNVALKEFTVFVNGLLKQTGLTFSILLLALKYIHRIKSRSCDVGIKKGVSILSLFAH